MSTPETAAMANTFEQPSDTLILSFIEITKLLDARVGWERSTLHATDKYAYTAFHPENFAAVEGVWLAVMAIAEKHGVEVELNSQVSTRTSKYWPVLMVSRREYEGKPLTCYVGGFPYYGNANERLALELEKGERVWANGKEGTVKSVFFYDGVNLVLTDGRMIMLETGGRIERVSDG